MKRTCMCLPVVRWQTNMNKTQVFIVFLNCYKETAKDLQEMLE